MCEDLTWIVAMVHSGPWKTRIAEPRRDGFLRWHGDDDARRAVVNNRTRLLSGVARAALSPARPSSSVRRSSSAASR